MSLLPTPSDADATQDGELRVRGVDDERTDAVFAALGSATARELLAALHDDPGTASELADSVDTSVQNALHHLENLRDADLVRVADTRYSEKGAEMKVYGPASSPTVVFVGTEERKRGLLARLGRLVGALAALAAASLLVGAVADGDVPYVEMTAAAGRADPGLPTASAVFLGAALTLALVVVGHLARSRTAPLLASVRASSLVVGRDSDRTRRAVRAATALFLAAGTALAMLGVAGHTLPDLGPLDPLRDGALLAVALATGQAWRNDGLVASWAFAAAPAAALALYAAGAGVASGRSPLALVVGVLGYGALLGGIGALALGTAGFTLGAGGRRLLDRVRARRRETPGGANRRGSR